MCKVHKQGRQMKYNIYIGVGNETPSYQFTDDFAKESDAMLVAERIAFIDARELAGTRGIKRREEIEFENAHKLNGLSKEAYEEFVDSYYNSYLLNCLHYFVLPTEEDTIKEVVSLDYM